MQNIDALEATIRYDVGCDSRSGRLDRWRVRLTDLQGRVVEDSNFESWMGGGVGTFATLAIGEELHWRHWLDLRSYVKPPPSGIYTLQLIHTDSYIASEPILDGLIVWTSEPIRVRVENQSPLNYSITSFRLLCICFVAGIVLVLKQLRTMRRQNSAGTLKTAGNPFRRDLLSLSLIFILIASWLCDSWHMKTDIMRNQPDSKADWSIRVED